MATEHGPFEAPMIVDPKELCDPVNQTRGERWSLVVMTLDKNGTVIGKHETYGTFEIPYNGTVVVLEVSDVSKMSDGTYPYNQKEGYLSI